MSIVCAATYHTQSRPDDDLWEVVTFYTDPYHEGAETQEVVEAAYGHRSRAEAHARNLRKRGIRAEVRG